MKTEMFLFFLRCKEILFFKVKYNCRSSSTKKWKLCEMFSIFYKCSPSAKTVVAITLIVFALTQTYRPECHGNGQPEQRTAWWKVPTRRCISSSSIAFWNLCVENKLIGIELIDFNWDVFCPFDINIYIPQVKNYARYNFQII